jgi:hypothetical protein
MSRWVITGVVLSILANIYLGFALLNHLQLIEELQEDRDSTEEAIDRIDDSIREQQAGISRLEKKPSVNVGALASTLATLRTDVDGIRTEVDDLSFRLDDVEFQLERPFGCYAGDPVYWASGFRGGLTC